jgi:RNA exonuclease 4
MVSGDLQCTDKHRIVGKYLALDCEMVGVGIDGAESSLARVSLVNFYGVVQLDEFVRQRERVVDYRTQYSGVRESDMIKAKPFNEIQTQVAELLKDRILVGHAVFNDLKVLLLSHPRPQTRDTQHYAHKFKLSPSKYAALRNLVLQELGVTIQRGEHSSVTDARATMAVFRLHRKAWEKGSRPVEVVAKKRKRGVGDVGGRDDLDEPEPGYARGFPGGGRKGVSSGLSTVVRGKKSKWWTELGHSTT